MNHIENLDLDRSALIRCLQTKIDQNSEKNKLAFLVLEINNLRTIEAHHGHELSLAMSAHVTELIKKILRPNDLVCKINDRRFAIVLNPVINLDHCTLAIQRLLSTLSKEQTVKQQKMRTNVRIGIALAPEHTVEAGKLLNYAEFALEKANALKSPYFVYNSQLAKKLVNEALLEDDLLNAIKNDELNVAYQPQSSLITGEFVGAEALVRWNSKKHGAVGPDIFIPIAENNRFIDALSEWLVNTVLRQCQPLLVQHPNFTVSVNASTPLFDNNFFVDFIERATSLWGFPPKQLVVEITESIMMRHPDRVTKTLNRLRKLGVRLAIDDFGTGFSSLTYLKKLPIQELKIDKSFLIGLYSEDENWKIVESVVDLANRFDLETVAEGIETEDTFDLIKDLGIDRAQGHLIGKPMPFHQLKKLLDNQITKSVISK